MFCTPSFLDHCLERTERCPHRTDRSPTANRSSWGEGGFKPCGRQVCSSAVPASSPAAAPVLDGWGSTGLHAQALLSPLSMSMHAHGKLTNHGTPALVPRGARSSSQSRQGPHWLPRLGGKPCMFEIERPCTILFGDLTLNGCRCSQLQGGLL